MQAVDDDDEYASTLLACLEMLRNGVTCFLEPGTAYEPDAVASAAQRIGIRGSVTDAYLWDRVPRATTRSTGRPPTMPGR